MRNVMAIQKEDKDFLRVFDNSEGDLDHEVVLLLSEMESHTEQQQLEEQWRERPTRFIT